jgi:phosphonate transport system ATP-binding protein
MLASNASLLLVDEPLSALDPERARQALQAICDEARERGATLVASLHHVEMALAHFPRIVGLRGGELVFDLPSAEVSPAILQSLYASNLDELTGPAPRMDDVPAARARVAMQCR